MHVTGREEHLSRPAVPPLLFVALGLWASTAACLKGLMRCGTAMDFAASFFGIACAVTCALVLAKARRTCPCARMNPLVLVVLGASLGVSCAAQAAYLGHVQSAYVEHAGPKRYVFQIVEDVHASEFGMYGVARARDENGRDFLVRVSMPSGASPKLWDAFVSNCEIRAPSDTAAEYYWGRGLAGSVSPGKIDSSAPGGVLGFVSRIREAGIAAYKVHEGAGEQFMRSIVFGDRRDLLESDLYAQVRRIGLAHLVAVSGAHLSIAVAALGTVMGALRAPKACIVASQVLSCVLFVLLTGAPHSALRACVMASCTLAAHFGRRASFSVNALSVCVIGCIVLQPHLCLSVSFLLSALATAGIVLFSAYFAQWSSVLMRGKADYLCGLLGMTLSAIAATSLVSAALFGQTSLVAPLANIVSTPIFAFLCVGGMAAGLLAAVFAPAAPFVGIMCEAADWFCSMVGAFASVPLAATVSYVPMGAALVGTIAIAAVLLWKWPAPTPRRAYGSLATIFAMLCGIFVVLPASHGCEIVMIDVGQGDAFVLRSGHRAVLVDTGNEDSSVLQGLARHDVRHLDAVVITHADDDHCGSLPSILDFVEVDRVVVASDLITCPCDNCASLRASAAGVSLEGVRAGDMLAWGAFSAEVVHPASFSEEGGNADSIVMYVRADADADGTCEASALFCGDAESEVLSALESEGDLVHADILKVGHHGSAGAVSAEQLSTISPRLALVSAGLNNRYGHPDPGTISILEDADVAVFRTDVSGDVVVQVKQESVNVVSSR